MPFALPLTANLLSIREDTANHFAKADPSMDTRSSSRSAA